MKKQDVFKRWKKRSLKFKIFIVTAFVLSLIAVPLLVLAVLLAIITKYDFASVWHSGLLYGFWGVVELVILIFVLFEYRTLGSRRVRKVNKDLEDSHFMTNREIARNDGFTVVGFNELETVKDGIPIIAETNKDGTELDVVLHDPIHTAMIATTGTGKTAAYISPSIEILSRTSTKPCMVITDPKGELYKRHAASLEKNGYHVHIIDMTDTYHSTLWNPFNDVARKTERISEPIIRVKNKYSWGGRLYATNEEAEKEKREYMIKLNDEIYIDLQDLIYTACPVDSGDSKSWQEGARDLLFGMALRMWEDLRDGYLPKEKFNLYNLWWNLTTYGKPNEKGVCEILSEYVNSCADENSRAPGMANTVLVSQDRTLTSYLGSVNQYLHWMADGGVAQLTSGNEIEFSEWDEGPNVLFIKIPDAKKNRHALVSLLLVQMYKALIEKATLNRDLGKTKDEELLRTCYFIMDEFGNLPKIQDMEHIVTIARSRKVFMLFVVQSLMQLENVYGKNASEIIQSNCNIKIFMGTDDAGTRRTISELCGKHKVKQVSYNEEKGMSVSTSAQSVPLIYESELEHLNDPKGGIIGNAIVTITGNYPIMGRTTPYFKAMELYGIEDGATPPPRDFMIFKEHENRYDITRLIYLHRNFDEEPSEDGGAELPQPDAEEVSTSSSRLALAKTRLAAQLKKELAKLKGKIPDEDYLLLITGDDVYVKIAILDELAENATHVGNIFLAMQIENIIAILRHGIDILTAADAAIN